MLRSFAKTMWFTSAAVALVLAGCNRSEPGTAGPGGTPEATMAPASHATPLEPAAEPLAASPEPAAAQTAANTAPAAQPAASAAAPAERKPDVVYVPTPQPLVDKMLALAKVKKTDLVYDLGCGDGRIVVTAAKKYGARAVGFDIDPKRIAEAKENVAKNGVEDLVTIEQKDIFTIDLSPANVVALYLLPELNVRLLPQLQQLKPGSRVVSHDYDIEGVKPKTHLLLKPTPTDREHDIYLWIAPLKRTEKTEKTL